MNMLDRRTGRLTRSYQHPRVRHAPTYSRSNRLAGRLWRADLRALSLLFSVLVGCATIPQGTAPSASPLVGPDGQALSYQVVGKAEGSASHFTLFGFIPFGRADIDGAIRQAKERLQGDNLINVHYYVENTSYLIFGNSTSITVKGDVVKYASSPLSTSSTRSPAPGELLRPGSLGLSHRLTLGSAVDGLWSDYTLSAAIMDYILFSFSLGYKKLDLDKEYFSSDDFHVITAALNFGATTKKAFRAPIDIYISGGPAYMPYVWPAFGQTSVEWGHAGFNINAGLSYEVTPGLGLGGDFRYFKALTEGPGVYRYSWDAFGRYEILNIAFSNVSFGITYYP